jgi:hypothetical protein
MGRPEIKIPNPLYIYGGDLEGLCRECQLPCKLNETGVDCLRRFFLQGLLQCSYFVGGYCFLVENPGCVFDNGGDHDNYWMNLLNPYYHNVGDGGLKDPDFLARMEDLKLLVADQIESRQVSLCRYLEEVYNRMMETGGGLSEEMMEKLDEAYMDLLSGTSRKK